MVVTKIGLHNFVLKMKIPNATMLICNTERNYFSDPIDRMTSKGFSITIFRAPGSIKPKFDRPAFQSCSNFGVSGRVSVERLAEGLRKAPGSFGPGRG